MEKKNNTVWEIVCYVGLALCIFGQITVGRYYLIAQTAYLIANVSALVRDYVIKLPRANKVKDFAFTAITAALIFCTII